MDWMSLLNQCLDIILPSVATVIAVIFGVIGTKIKQVCDAKLQTDTAKTVVADVVKFVQQIYKDADGSEKLQKALTEASTILNEKGISVSETELNMLIESAVYGLKHGNETPVITNPADTDKTSNPVTEDVSNDTVQSDK